MRARWSAVVLSGCAEMPDPAPDVVERTCAVETVDADLQLPAPAWEGVRFEVTSPVADGRVPDNGPATTSLLWVETPGGSVVVGVGLRCGEGMHPVLDPATWETTGCWDDVIPAFSANDATLVGAFDLDGDGVYEVLTERALWRWEGAAWRRLPLSDPADACAPRVQSPAVGDLDGDGDQDLVSLRGFGALPCAATHETAVALLQGPDGAFTADPTRVVDRSTPEGGRWLQGYGMALVQAAPGAKRWLLAIGDTVGSLANDDLERLCLQHPGLWIEGDGGFEVVDALEPDATLRRRLDLGAVVDALGLTGDIDGGAGTSRLFEAVGLDAETATVRGFEEAIPEALPGRCFEDFERADPCVQVTTTTPMGAAVLDVDGDGWMEVVVTSTFEPFQLVLQVDPGGQPVWRDLTAQARMRWPFDGGGPGTFFARNNPTFGWATVPVDLDGDHRVDVISANGWDDQWFYGRDTPNPALPELHTVEVHHNTGVVRPGEQLPIMQRVTEALMASTPPISGFALCPADVDADGRLDWLVGADWDTNGEVSLGPELPATRDGAPTGPFVLHNRSTALSFTVALARLDGDAWLRVRFASGVTQLQRYLDVASPGVTCHPVHQVSWVDDPPVLLEVLDGQGAVGWSTEDPAALAAGRRWTIPW